MSKDASHKFDHEHEKTKAEERKLLDMEERENHRKLKRKSTYAWWIPSPNRISEQEKEEEKARKAEEKAMKKDRRRSLKTGEKAEPETTAPTTTPDTAAVPVETRPEPVVAATTLPDRSEVLATPANTAVDETPSPAGPLKAPKSGTSEDSGKVKNWLKTKLNRRSSRAQAPPSQTINRPTNGTTGNKFIGGAALTGGSPKTSTTNLATDTASAKVTPVAAPAVPPEAEEQQDRVGRSPTRGDISPASSPTSMYEDLVSHDNERVVSPETDITGLTPPPKFPLPKASSPARSTRFTEEI